MRNMSTSSGPPSAARFVPGEHIIDERGSECVLPEPRHEDLYTVQAPLDSLRANIHPSYWTPQLQFISDGKLVGEAIRMTGPNEVYVRFRHNLPEACKCTVMSFTLPKQFLIPVSCRQFVHGQQQHPASTSAMRPPITPQTPPTAGVASFASQPNDSMAMGLPTSSSHYSHNNSKYVHDHVDLHQHLGTDGEPMLCVVCGKWDTGTRGQKRKSGHKCQGCVGRASLPRLREEFGRLLKSEADDTSYASDTSVGRPVSA